MSFGNYETALEWILNLLIDDGVKSRIHRDNLFRPDINSIGIGFSKHPDFDYWYVIDYSQIQKWDSQIDEDEESNNNDNDFIDPNKNRMLTNINVLLNINDESCNQIPRIDSYLLDRKLLFEFWFFLFLKD